jgi:ATP-binding cassette subfamily B protein
VGIFIALMGTMFLILDETKSFFDYTLQKLLRKNKHIEEFNQYINLSRKDDALVPMSETPPRFESLEFKNVSFTYPGTEKLILNNLSLTIEAGKRYALVGVNGCGKTTLTKLLLKLYDDYTGEILLNGKSLRDWCMADIKAMFTAVFQDFARYDISVFENVSVGSGMRATEAEIDNALEVVGLTEAVSALKNGKHTLLGKVHTGGVEFSGGQWQKIAIARAIVSPAQIKILDEPTAALDPIAEQEVYQQFDKISRGSATIFISHRLASARMADTIFVMDSGKIIEQGSHDALMETGGKYADMYNSQREWYL